MKRRAVLQSLATLVALPLISACSRSKAVANSSGAITVKPLNKPHEEWRGLSQRIHDLALPVSSFDFSNPVLERHRKPGGSGGQITVRQCIGDPRLFAFVGSELRGESAEPDLEPRLGVMGHEAGQPFGSKRPEVAGPIELMQASPL